MIKKILITIFLMLVPCLAFAGEKEELDLRKQLLEERLVRIEAQGTYLQMLFNQTQQELTVVKEKLKQFPEEQAKPK